MTETAGDIVAGIAAGGFFVLVFIQVALERIAAALEKLVAAPKAGKGDAIDGKG